MYKNKNFFLKQLVEELVSGMCVALEIRAQNASSVFREFCGPHDPVNEL
jgi:nucleoside diphosphate kinase